MKEELAELDSQGYDIIYLDEVVFSSKTYSNRTWSPVNRNLQMDLKHAQMPPIACIACISYESGLDMVQ